jgi:hypothetical protein
VEDYEGDALEEVDDAKRTKGDVWQIEVEAQTEIQSKAAIVEHKANSIHHAEGKTWKTRTLVQKNCKRLKNLVTLSRWGFNPRK